MTGHELQAARKALGLSAEALARALHMPGRGRTVRRWEKGESEVPGPVEVALAALLEKHKIHQEDPR